ncbi:MAG: hypothetical protein FWF15_02810 [Oscillospiraceae bacterium]|nr:hypothetical protein [Oscillospiraceae bacterium]
MKLTSEMIKAKAAELGIDDIGIANIERYSEAPPLMNPKNYFPNAKSVIVIVQRIPRGTYRGIEEGTHWHNYTFYAYNRLNMIFRPKLTYSLACFIEDHGWEAVPHYPAVSEREPTRPPVAPGKLPANIATSIRLMAVGAGVGEMGHSKVFLNPKFGPRVRLDSIMTDAELEPDPMIKPGTLCNKCGRCVKDCPADAIPGVKETDKLIKIRIGGIEISWADVDMGKCVLTHHGLNNTISPFLKKDFPNFEFDVSKAEMTEEEAYRLAYPATGGQWGMALYDEYSSATMKYPSYVRGHGGYYALCGARGCIRACMDNLEKNNKIKNTFKNPFYKKPQWLLSHKKDEKVGVINPFREKWFEENHPNLIKGEQGYENE